MDKPIKVLLGGVTCAALVVGAGFANSYRLESNVRKYEAQCVEEGKQDMKRPKGFILLCDSTELIKSERTSSSAEGIHVGVQGKIASAHQNLVNSREWPYSLAAIVLVISGVPWLWYFFLRRIRELRDAISGK